MGFEHERDDAGAYVLGALTPGERAAYERHLATCSFCREAVNDMAVLPGLLNRLDPDEFAKMFDPSLTSRRPRRSRTGVRIASTLAAAVLVALIAGGAVALTARPDEPPPAVAMVPVAAAVPLSAQVGLTTTPGGTQIRLVCLYQGGKPLQVRLVAIGADHGQEQVGSWDAPPNKEFSMAGVTHLGSGELSRLELVRSDGGTLLSYDVP